MHRMQLSLALGAMLALTVAGPALGAPPTREIIDVGTTEIEGFIAEHMTDVCGFEISVAADATIAVMIFTDKDGNVRREIDSSQIKWTLTNVETEVSIWTHSVGPDIFWVDRDGTPMHAIVGRSYLAHEGSGFIGRLLLNEDTGDVVAFAGRMTGDIQQLVCAPLTP